MIYVNLNLQIVCTKDLLKESNIFFPSKKLKVKNRIDIPITLYFGFISAIPVTWKAVMCTPLIQFVETTHPDIIPLPRRLACSVSLKQMCVTPN